MQPSDFPKASAADVVPLALGLPRGERFFCTGRTCARRRAARRRLRVRVLRCPAGSRGPFGTSQVTGPSVAAAPWSFTPPGVSPPSPCTGDDDCCLQGGKPLGTRKKQVFGAAFPTAQRLACLRISRTVATPTARLATNLPGSALAGGTFTRWTTNQICGSHRTTSSFWTSIAWSHRRGLALSISTVANKPIIEYPRLELDVLVNNAGIMQIDDVSGQLDVHQLWRPAVIPEVVRSNRGASAAATSLIFRTSPA
jgi:hypothetical protein